MTLESMIVIIAYCLQYGAIVFIASLAIWLVCEAIEYALEVFL